MTRWGVSVLAHGRLVGRAVSAIELVILSVACGGVSARADGDRDAEADADLDADAECPIGNTA